LRGVRGECGPRARGDDGLRVGRSSFVGSYGAAFVGEVFCEGIVGKGAEAGDDAFGVEDCAGHGGVGVGVAEERFDCGLAEGVVAAGDDFVEVDEADVLGCSDLLGPAAVGVGLAADFAVDPDFAGDERAEDGRGAFGLGVGDVFAHVPAEGVDGVGGIGEGIGDVERLFADAGEAAAGVGAAGPRGPGRVDGCGGVGGVFVDRGVGGLRSGRGCAGVGDGGCAGEVDAAVVVAELDEDEVAGLDEGEGVRPMALGDVGVAGEAADGAVDDVDLGRVEEVGDRGAPSPESVGAEAVAVADGGVADQDEGWKGGVGGAGEAEAGFLGGGVLRRPGCALGLRGCRGGGVGWSCCGGCGLLGGEENDGEEAGECGGEQGGVGACGSHGMETGFGGGRTRAAEFYCGGRGGW
jgi:hypothetical protein